ncbi:hypothetical protein HZB74_02830 [Candidatus Saccharibacteria bacterium]|nr:hypothetical protein [Candidatus Saccharibacteria bacterium]
MSSQSKTINDEIGFYDPHKTFEDNFNNGPFPAKDFKPQKQTAKSDYKFLGYPINSPFGIPAGSLPTSQHIKYAFETGFDVVCYKTQRSGKFPVNQFPNVLYVDTDGDLTLEKAKNPLVGREYTDKGLDEISITNSFGNPSKGPEFWVGDLKKALGYEKDGQLLIMSVVGTIRDGYSQEDYYDDFARAAKLAASTGVKAIEINLSCPNVANEGILCYSKDAVVSVCKKVKQAVGDAPLIVKFGYFSESQQDLLEDIVSNISEYISAISVINTIPVAVVDEDGNQALPGEGRLMSGICGAGIKWAGLDMVKRLNLLRKKKNYRYEIIGVGGVMNAQDFKEYRNAGADVVQSATGSMWNPELAQEVKANL